MKNVVVDQTKQWSEMMEKHRKEEWKLLNDHLKMQEEVLINLMAQAQAKQLKEIEEHFERYVNVTLNPTMTESILTLNAF